MDKVALWCSPDSELQMWVLCILDTPIGTRAFPRHFLLIAIICLVLVAISHLLIAGYYDVRGLLITSSVQAFFCLAALVSSGISLKSALKKKQPGIIAFVTLNVINGLLFIGPAIGLYNVFSGQAAQYMPDVKPPHPRGADFETPAS